MRGFRIVGNMSTERGKDCRTDGDDNIRFFETVFRVD